MRITLIFLIFLTSCSLFKNKNNYPYGHKRSIEQKDFEKNLVKITDVFIKENRNKIKIIKIEKNKYLRSALKRITSNNETLLEAVKEGRFIVVKDKRSYHFSLPGQTYVFSSAIINKFMKSEDIFLAALVSGLLRTEYGIYNKQSRMTFAGVQIEDLIKLTHISIKNRMKVNTIAYEVIERTGIDPEVLLLWVQMKNRNTAEFSMMYENETMISREEYLLKNFLVTKGRKDQVRYEKNSSSEYYRFKDIVLAGY
jgi:hypothetical protein